VFHESDIERAAVWLDRNIAVNSPFRNASPSCSRGNVSHFSSEIGRASGASSRRLLLSKQRVKQVRDSLRGVKQAWASLRMATMENVSFRRMTDSDLPAAHELRRLAGWNQTLGDWRRLLWLEPRGCFVAAQDGAVVGTVTTTTYGQALAWIGMMLVHAEHQRRGIGARLMRQALEYLQGGGVECVKLDATPAGRPVYERLGFVPESTLTRYQRPASGQTQAPEPAAASARALTDADWEVVEEIDHAAFGASRACLLRSLAHDSRAMLVWPAQGRVVGWGMVRPGANADYLGPLVCSSYEGSLSLQAALLGRAGSHSVIWDVPDQNELAKTTALRFGFTPIRPLTRMRLGSELVVGNRHYQFAIADPALG